MNQDSMLYIILGLTVIVVVVVVVLIMVMTKNRMLADSARQIQQLQNDNAAALNAFSMQLGTMMRNDLDNMTDATLDRLGAIQSHLDQGMAASGAKTEEAFRQMLTQMVRIDATQKKLDELSGEMTSLQKVLIDKKTRGTYGEIELYTLLQAAYGADDRFWRRQHKLANGSLADAVLIAPPPLGLIVIDSKFPLEDYRRMYDPQLTKAEQQAARRAFSSDVVKHIKDIAAKYIVPPETAEFAYMFVPAEAVFAEIYGQFDDVVELSYRSHVFIVSPTTMMAYVTAIKAIYLGQQRRRQDVEMQTELAKLSQQFAMFTSRWAAVAHDIDKIGADVQGLDVTAGKISRQFERIATVQLDDRQEGTDEQEDD